MFEILSETKELEVAGNVWKVFNNTKIFFAKIGTAYTASFDHLFWVESVESNLA